MNRKALVAIAGIGTFVGAYIPVLLGWDDGFGLWSILGGFIGGMLGIWLGVQIAKRY